MSFIKQHKYYLITFAVLLIIAGISGYFAFTTHNNFTIHDTLNTIQNEIQNTQNTQEASLYGDNIQTTKEQASGVPSPLQGEGQGEVNSEQPNIQETIMIEEVETTSTESKIKNPTTLKIAGEEYSTEFKEGTTVFELMQTLTAMSIKPFSFSGKDYGAGMGYFVEEINGIKNDPQTGKYWIYYVNNKSAQVGISNYIINRGDVIEWKYENTF